MEIYKTKFWIYIQTIKKINLLIVDNKNNFDNVAYYL